MKAQKQKKMHCISFHSVFYEKNLHFEDLWHEYCLLYFCVRLLVCLSVLRTHRYIPRFDGREAVSLGVSHFVVC